MRNATGKTVAVAAILLMGTALAGCREGAMDKPIVKQKGVYQGAPMPNVPEEKIDAARERARSTQGQL